MGYESYQDWKDVVLDGKKSDLDYTPHELSEKMKHMEQII
jgi:hypothetical protein